MITYLAVCLLVADQSKRHDEYAAVPRVPLICSFHILTFSVIYCRTDGRQHEFL